MPSSAPHDVPRPEYPRPQLVREDWLNLNGPWQFEIDAGDSGLERGLRERELSGTITVPFAPESELSGLGHADFMEAVWYRRTVTIPAAWAGRRTLLHFGAVDHDATVWVNGVEVARHRGGFSPFTADLSAVARPGEEATIVVRARDSRRGPQARGKQSTRYQNFECLYTRTTGIWQTVWLEPVPDVHLRRPRITPDVATSSFNVVVPLSGNRPGSAVRVTVSDGDGVVATATVRADVDLAPPYAFRWTGYACGSRATASSTASGSSCSTRRAPSRTPPAATPGYARSRSTAGACSSTAAPSSSGSCSTRATTPTAS
jgi:beta-galactosidase/beta-glucuronidase